MKKIISWLIWGFVFGLIVDLMVGPPENSTLSFYFTFLFGTIGFVMGISGCFEDKYSIAGFFCGLIFCITLGLLIQAKEGISTTVHTKIAFVVFWSFLGTMGGRLLDYARRKEGC